MSDQQDKEKNWEAGFHISSNGRRIDLQSIDTNYLQNMIRRYSGEGYDVTALNDELAKRS